MKEQIFKIALSLFILAGCESKREADQVLKINVPDVKINIDPHKMEDAFSMLIVSQIHRGLLRFDSQGNIVSDLAEKWTISPDKLKYRFQLRNRTFSNGTPITSQNVIMSFARIFFLEAGFAADIDYIKGIAEFQKSKDISKLGIEAINEKEVEFELSQPSALFLKHIAVVDCAILPIEKFDSEINLTEKGSYSGPFKITEIKNGKEFYLEKWRSDELDSASPPKSIQIFASSENSLQLAADGKTDSLDGEPVDSKNTDELIKKGWGAVPSEITSETFVILNPNNIPLEARRYLYGLVDSKKVVKLIGDKSYKPAFGLIPNGMSGVLPESDVLGLKKESSAVYKGPKVSFTLDFEKSSEAETKTAEYLLKIWSAPNIEVKLNPLSKKDKLSRMFAKESESVIGRKGVDYPDGFSVLTYFKGKYQSNYFHVYDTKIDEAITAALNEFNQDKRDEDYRRIQIAVLKHYTNIPLFFGSQASGLWSPKVKSVPSHPMGFHTMQLETIEMRAQ